MESKWQQALDADPELSDRPLFRMEKAKWAEDGSGAKLHLGITSVKEYIGTNRLPFPMRQIRRQDGAKNANDQDAHMANPLGCEVVLVTSDHKVVLLWCTGESSKLCPDRFASRSQGRFNGPWASPEPERAGVDGAAEAAPEMQKRIVAELFDAALRAVEERTSLPREKLSQPRFIGSMSDSRHYKPELLFLIHSSLDAAGVRARYKESAGGADDLDFWPMDSFTDCPILVSCVVRAAARCMTLLAPSEPVWKEHPPSAGPAASTKQAAKAKPKPEAKPKADDKASESGPRPTWRVVGGADKGIVVREACDRTSAELPRLAHGARVEELARTGDRLQYKKLEGDGPDSGWVSVAVSGKELLVRE